MITSIDNAQVKHLVRLREKAKYRRDCGQYIVEGPRMAREVPQEMLEAVYMLERFEAAHPEDARQLYRKAQMAGAACERLSEAAFAKASGTVTPQGVLCVVRQRKVAFADLLAAEGTRVLLVLEGIRDPGNLGTMLRTGEAAGVSGIIADEETADLYQPKVVRGTMGAIFRVPYVRVPDPAACIGQIRAAGIRTVATLPGAGTDYTSAPLGGDTAFLVGNEGRGLSAALAEAADIRVRIPMEGQAESLNAAVAAALCLYEAKRQRDLKR